MKSPDVIREAPTVQREEYEARNGHRAAVLWLTGLPGSGKSSIARALERRLLDAGHRARLLEGDRLRRGVCSDLSFSSADRTENVRRAAEVAQILFDYGDIVICAFVSPYAGDRDRVRQRFPRGQFLEIFVDCPLAECVRRDPKGLYARAKAGEVQHMTGLHDRYEPPVAPELIAHSDREPVEQITSAILTRLAGMHILWSECAPGGQIRPGGGG